MVKPRCPHCNAQGLKNLAVQHAGSFAVVYCGQCGAIYGVTPVTQKQKPPPLPKKEETPEKTPPPPKSVAITEDKQNYIQKPQRFLDHLYQTDLSKIAPYSPEKLAARAKAARMNPGTMYMRYTLDHGPPQCPKHKTDMQKIVVPPGHPNSDQIIWICSEFDCREWELAE